ncbi:MAG: LamG domain-containing protein, partial [Okeania sp. SIO1H6]|nr:LamG domain-containing protein [Okeania sp. SIO1H6]
MLPQTAMKSDLTVEAWVDASDISDTTARLLHHNSEQASYTLALQEASNQTDPKRYHIIAGVSQGIAENHKGQRFLKSIETISTETWNHLVMRFRQSYGLHFNGSSYLNCGNNQMLDIAEDLTIEVFLQLEQLGTYQGIIGKGFLGESLKSVPYRLSITSNNKLEFIFEDADGGDHSYYSTQTLTTRTFYRIAVIRKKGRTQKENQGIKTITYEDADGNPQTSNLDVVESVDVEEWFDISLYINGVQQGNQPARYDGEAPLGNNEPLEIGRCLSSPRQQHYFQGIIAEVRLW